MDRESNMYPVALHTEMYFLVLHYKK